MNYGLSDKVRAKAKATYVGPAASKGRHSFSIPVKEILHELEREGFPSNHARQVCTALTTGKFLRENSIQIEAIDGPPSKTSTTVVVHYKFAPAVSPQVSGTAPTGTENIKNEPHETPEEWAHRMTGKLFGLMKDELAAFGGGEAFLRWVRGYDEDDEAA
jgi:hypothetical protein